MSVVKHSDRISSAIVNFVFFTSHHNGDHKSQKRILHNKFSQVVDRFKNCQFMKNKQIDNWQLGLWIMLNLVDTIVSLNMAYDIYRMNKLASQVQIARERFTFKHSCR